MIRNLLRLLPLSVLSIFLLALSSCEKFSGDQTIPAYISIDSIYLQTDFETEGTTSQNITDAWVYVDENLVGTFQMPCHFPVLYKGVHDVTILSGIKRNGIASTRTTYPFYASIVKTVNLVPDSTVNIGVVKTTYMSTTKFLWMESFEDISISLDTTKNSKAALHLTEEDSPLTFEGKHSGMIKLDTSKNFFELSTHNYYKIPSAPVYLEMNFNTNNTFQVGVIVYTTDYLIYQTPVLNLAPTSNKWKKIYIDLTTTLNSYLNSTNFRVYLGGYKDSSVADAVILFDNFKLVSR
jgi:hypothetical protein